MLNIILENKLCKINKSYQRISAFQYLPRITSFLVCEGRSGSPTAVSDFSNYSHLQVLCKIFFFTSIKSNHICLRLWGQIRTTVRHLPVKACGACPTGTC